MLIAIPAEHRSNFHRLMLMAKWIEENRSVEGHDLRAAYGHCLLKFYAAESGLKFLLAKKEKIRHRHEVSGDSTNVETVEGFGHDLVAMAKRLRAPATSALGTLDRDFKLAGGYKPKGVKQPVPTKKIHEAWRYGLVIDSNDQIKIETGIRRLIIWIEQEIAVA